MLEQALALALERALEEQALVPALAAVKEQARVAEPVWVPPEAARGLSLEASVQC